MNYQLEQPDMQAYLASTYYIDWENPAIVQKAAELFADWPLVCEAFDNPAAKAALINTLLPDEEDAPKRTESAEKAAAPVQPVDIETLTKTNEQLIQTLDEVQQIQAEGHAKRVQAEKELARMEGELRDKLLLINDNK